ncbi:MAG: phosphatase PAP2 family protein [Alicyclobacillaceae bacterium]|nr:phosphatase PAP2 family protein [Alicyclobacillaceae bacterium]
MTRPDFPLPKGFLWQYEWIQWLQAHSNPWLDSIAKGLSMLGNEQFYLLAIPIVFWSVHRKLGLRLGYIFLFGMWLNSWLKVLIGIVRPIGIPGIQSAKVASATGYSMPSGHAQGTMTFWMLLSSLLKRRIALWIGMILVLLVGWSRIVLGLHWPLDVMVGWGIGLLVASLGWALGGWWTYRQFSFSSRAYLAVVLPLLMLALHTTPTGKEYAVFLLSLGLGALFEEHFLHTEIEDGWWRRIFSSVIGIAGLIAIQWGMKRWGSTEEVLLVRDAAIGLFATVVAPWLFLKCGLYRREGSHPHHAGK